ncbi:OTU domain-containing protein 3 isoform X3 [Myotis lucifugus]|uniref:OTU domain-containing protein 3 isoform X3 n=1 Tax=Myotis lucifugus TaxID=59463 RepID=UPI0006D71F8A|nr:OTU domain-containing protein 3 isoform X3 [Myotis lucifugus]
MSRKQAAKSRPGSGSRKAEAERKRDERAARRALAKERRNRPESGGGGEEEFVSFANQLQALGLKLREVPGDGNCLFRALGDQLEGHSRNHLQHRQETVDYMIKQREDFEPFVEDDIPFEKHVASLAKPGTFAGNDAIVAFARNHQLNVVIHQLNAPLWQIRGTDKSSVRELHIAYRYGEHYDSVRRINDNSEAPAHLQTDFQILHQDESNKREKVKTKGVDFEDDLRDEVEDAVQKVCNATGCSDFNLIVQNLEAENYNIESAIIAMLQMNQGKRNSHKQAAPRAAALREEEAAGGAAPSQSPREQEQPQGQRERSGGQRAGHFGEDLRCSQHLTPLPAGVVRSEWKWRAVPRLPRRRAFGPPTEPTQERTSELVSSGRLFFRFC